MVLVAIIIRNFADNCDEIRKLNFILGVNQLYFENGLVLPEWIDVELKILAVWAVQTIARLAHSLKCGVGLHHEIEIFGLCKSAFCLDADGRIGRRMFGGFGIDIPTVKTALADATLELVFILEVSLRNLDALTVRKSFELLELRHLNQEFALNLIGLRYAEKLRDLLEEILEFLFEVAVILDYAQMRMSDPTIARDAIELSGLLRRLAAGTVVAERIELFGAIGCRYEVKYGTVAPHDFALCCIEVLLNETQISAITHVGLIVANAAIADNENIVVSRDVLGGLLGDFFLLILRIDDHRLKVSLRHHRRQEAIANLLRSRLIDEDNVPAQLGHVVLNVAGGGRLAGTGASRECYDLNIFGCLCFCQRNHFLSKCCLFIRYSRGVRLLYYNRLKMPGTWPGFWILDD